MVNSADAVLDQRPEALYGLRMHVAIDVDAGSMVFLHNSLQ